MFNILSPNLSGVQTRIEPSLTKFIYKRRYIPHPFLIDPLMYHINLAEKNSKFLIRLQKLPYHLSRFINPFTTVLRLRISRDTMYILSNTYRVFFRCWGLKNTLYESFVSIMYLTDPILAFNFICGRGGKTYWSFSYLAYHFKKRKTFHLSISLWNNIFDILSPNLSGVLTRIVIAFYEPSLTKFIYKEDIFLFS